MFEPSLQIDKLNDDDEIKNRRVEGVRLALMTPIDDGRTLQEDFIGYFMIFVKRHNFTPAMASFVKRSHGPEWFICEFLALGADQEAESLEIWEAFLIPKLVSIRLGTMMTTMIPKACIERTN